MNENNKEHPSNQEQKVDTFLIPGTNNTTNLNQAQRDIHINQTIINNTERQPIPLDLKEQRKAVEQFLQEIENEFQYIKLFHVSQKIALTAQYIPIQVTLERRYQDKKNEGFRSYAESEEEAKRLYAIKGSLEEFQRTQVDWQEAKKKHQIIMVLADPGMGKSTLLRMEALTIAKEQRKNLSNLESVTLPLYLRLSALAEEQGEIIDIILRLITKNRKNSKNLESLLRDKLEKGECLLLLDALDEVPTGKRPKLKKELNTFIRSYNLPVIGTSRIVGYSSFLDDSKEMEIVPFTEKQTEEYIEIWFKNAANFIQNNEVSAAGLIAELQTKPQIQGLTQNPLLLSLICSLYQTQDLKLPTRRTQVYEQATNTILSRWSRENNRPLSDEGWIDAKNELLKYLAYEFSCENVEVFPIEDLREKINKFLDGTNNREFSQKTATDLIKELSEEDGIIQKLYEYGKQYLFLHRTFQEYLTASYLIRKIKEKPEDGIALVKQHFWQFDWHETISLVAGLMRDPIPLLKTITQEPDDIFKTLLLLAGLCITECQNNKDILIEISSNICQFWLSYPQANFIKSIVVGLGKIGNQPAIDHLIKALEDSDDTVRWYAAEALGKIGNEKAVDPLIKALEDSDDRVRWYAAEALGKIGNEKAVDPLIKALEDSDDRVRWYAAEALGKIGNEKAVDPLIKALEDSDDTVRWYAAAALGKIGNEKAVDPLIKALEDSNDRVRWYAAEALGKIGNEKALDPFIKALEDSNDRVRWYAAEALGKIGNEKAVDPLIKALEDSDDTVRWYAAEALGKIGNVEILKKLMQKPDQDFFYSPEIFFLARKLMVRYSRELQHPLRR